MDEYFDQFKNYYLSSLDIINILKSDNKEDYNNDWSDEIFFAIPSDFIINWKSLINFNNICEIMELNKDNKIIDQQKNMIIELIKINKGLKKSINNIGVHDLHDSLVKSIGIDNVFPYKKFFLVSKKAWYSFDRNHDLAIYSKIKIRKGNRKILIKIENYFVVFYLEMNEKKVEPTNLEECLNKIVINIENNDNKEWIEDLVRLNIYDWFKSINYPPKGDNYNKEYKYKDNNFIIAKEDLYFSFYKNISEIQSKYSSMSKSEIKATRKILSELHFNNILVVDVKKSSFIISSMYSLSQIKDLFDYCNDSAKKKLFFEKTRLLYLFTEFLFNLWKKNNEGEKYIPKDFMQHLNRKNNTIFDFKEEKEPIVFLEYIIQELNQKLNNKDHILKKEIINSKKVLINDQKFKIFYDDYIKGHNSIMSKLFYGIFHIKNKCLSCGEYEYYDYFNHIILDINEYIKYQSKSDNSLTDYYLDDFIEFYFNNSANEEIRIKCSKCKENNIIECKKTIISFPENIIFSINWGKFESKGLELEENKFNFDKNQVIDLAKYSFNQINKDEIKYRLRSVINFPIINEKNINNRTVKKFITISRHLKDQKIYSYKPSGGVEEINYFNKRNIVPFVLFYEKINNN